VNKQQEDNKAHPSTAQSEIALHTGLEEPKNKPLLRLIGQDGNAFAILGKAQRVAKSEGWNKERIEAFMTEAMSDDYDKLLQTCMKYFEVD